MVLGAQNRALLLDGSEYAAFDLASEAPALIAVTQWSLRVRGRLMSGDSMLALLTVTTGALGRMAALPDWISRGAVVGTQVRLRTSQVQIFQKFVPKKEK